MSAERAVLQVTGRLPPDTLAQLEQLDGRLQVRTLLRVTVRDEAALQGVLRRLHDLGLELVEIRPLEGFGSARSMEASVNGPVGDLALEALSDHIEVRATATRVGFADPDSLSRALVLVVAEGLAVEYASALPVGGERRAAAEPT